MTVERTGPFSAIEHSFRTFGKRFGVTLVLWFLSLLVAGLIWIVPTFISPVRELSVDVVLRNCVQFFLISAVEGILNGALINIFLSHASSASTVSQAAAMRL